MATTGNSLRVVLTIGLTVAFLVCIGIAMERFSKSQIGIVVKEREVDSVVFPVMTFILVTEPEVYERLDAPWIGQLNQSLVASNGTKYPYMDLRNSALLSQYELPNPWVNVSYANVKVHQFYTGMKSEIGGLLHISFNQRDYPSIAKCLELVIVDPDVNFYTRTTAFGKIRLIVPEVNHVLYPNTTMVLRYSFEIVEKTYKSRKERPCMDTEKDGNSFQNCFENFLASLVDCGPIPLGESLFHTCSTSEVIRIFQAYEESGMSKMGDQGLIQRSGCIPPCKLRMFKLNPPTTIQFYNELSGVHDKYRLILEFIMTKPTIEEHEEVYLFDGNNLLADIGGFLGMLLGASCLTLFDKMMTFMQWVQEKSRKIK